jgi:hypothetical protein
MTINTMMINSNRVSSNLQMLPPPLQLPPTFQRSHILAAQPRPVEGGAKALVQTSPEEDGIPASLRLL